MQRNAFFRAARMSVILVISIAIAVLLIRLQPKAERRTVRENDVLVEAEPVFPGESRAVIESFGTVYARQLVPLTAEVSGQVVQTNASFLEGGFVHGKETLVKIDPRRYRLQADRQKGAIRQIEAELKHLNQQIKNLDESIAIARSDMDLAKAELERMRQLAKAHTVSQTNLDQTEQKFLGSLERFQRFENEKALTGPMREKLDAQLESAKVALEQALLDLEKAEIVSPFDGWVVEKKIEVGQYVVPGGYLGSVYRDGALDVDVNIAWSELKWLSDIEPANQDAEILTPGSDESVLCRGRIVRIKSRIDEKTRTIPIVVETLDTGDDQRNRLRPGMFVRVRLKGRKLNDVFELRRSMIQPGDVVYVFKDGKLHKKEVKVLHRFKERVLVADGLEAGELVITSPLASPVEGMRVRTR